MQNQTKNDKIKEKIEKLLNLSLSENVHEASVALNKAMELMYKYNLTEDDIRKQTIITKVIMCDYYRLPRWLIFLNNILSNLSGCFCIYQNGNKTLKIKSKFQITGKESDVQNFCYLSEFLTKICETKTNEYSDDISGIFPTKEFNNKVKSFRFGFINGIYSKLKKEQQTFFVNNAPEKYSIIPVDIRIKEAEDFFMKNTDIKISTDKTKISIDSNTLFIGQKTGEKVNINPAVTNQKELYLLK